MMYSLDEIGLIPAVKSDIKHRGDINPFVESPFGGEKLPIFVAPMTCILNANNICEFSQSKVEPILPVISADWELRAQLPNGSDWMGWTALSLQEFDKYFNQATLPANRSYYILIDVANGHMSELYEMVKRTKDLYPRLTVMIGNIANPETYIECCKAKVDYVRVGIGGGGGCTTSVQTGIHASMPWLLSEITNYKRMLRMYQEYSGKNKDSLVKAVSWNFEGIDSFGTKVIADGGISSIDKAIKCLALGADYVMMGKQFARCKEACGPTIDDGYRRLYYGQSSILGQKDRFGKVKSHPEGTNYWVDVNTTLKEFTNEFEASLRSAMSYCNAKNLSEFIGKAKWEIMSQSEFNAYNK